MGKRATSDGAIITAAQRVIAERGPGKLRLSAVADAAGVSRQTLYRWFPTKDHLLAAITEREKETFDTGLLAVLERQSHPSRRLEVALHYLVTYLDGSMGSDPIGVDPAFALASLAAALEPQAEAMVRVLGDALDTVPSVRTGVLSRSQAATIFLRLAYSHYLVPHPEPDRLLDEIRGFAGLTQRAARRATA